MSIQVHISDGPLAMAAPRAVDSGRAGAVVTFEGVVRAEEDNREIAALDYEVYEPMARLELERLARWIRDECHLLAVEVEHSRGRVPVGCCSFRLRIASAHRKEALHAMDLFIDRMKENVPIWKSPVYSGQAPNAESENCIR